MPLPNMNPTRRKHNAGVASLEFALIAILMVLILLGMFVYWRALQAQQSVARATGDGARLVQNLIYGALPDYGIENIENMQAAAESIVKASLLNSAIPGDPSVMTLVTLNQQSSTQLLLQVSYRLPAIFSTGTADHQPQPLNLGQWALTQPALLQATSTVSFSINE
ncbi:pilus assembly protein [Lampropedia puyangensis]|uniref:Pilus assembly protein n=1 Tax=Lampropedia puyangensis TaxID=1330072 RepID=A0A4S8F027_9BURK|nr:TadE/TadG family type IV pilus assembly protein [Lampropedia puyangensis]THT99960.1 pilus assembly protein [Lampropedia puyangensis]